jgi:hypothetical protein
MGRWWGVGEEKGGGGGGRLEGGRRKGEVGTGSLMVICQYVTSDVRLWIVSIT